KAYSEKYKEYLKARKEFEKLSKEAFELKKEADFNNFQLEELAAIKLVEGEQMELEEQQEILDNAEEIKARINEALRQLNAEQYGAMTLLGQFNHSIGQLSRYGHKFIELKERFASA